MQTAIEIDSQLLDELRDDLRQLRLDLAEIQRVNWFRQHCDVIHRARRTARRIEEALSGEGDEDGCD